MKKLLTAAFAVSLPSKVLPTDVSGIPGSGVGMTLDPSAYQAANR